jgi:hypothetical protein
VRVIVMAQASTAAMPDALGASRARRRASGLAGTIVELWRGLKALFNPYRPELHYMRGPGPKWREKHGRA